MKKIFAAFFSFFFLLYGCGTTNIYVSNADADIYVGNIYKGKGSAKITRAGSPSKKTVTAVYNGQTVGEVKIKREFDVVTALVGLYTYGLGFIFCWRYPSYILIPTTTQNEIKADNQSIWMKPPRMWTK